MHWKEVRATFLGLFAAGLLKLIGRTLRIEQNTIFRDCFNSEEPRIVVLWHGEQGLSCCFLDYCKGLTNLRLSALVSPHHDGRMAGTALQRFGMKIIWGSSSQQGSRALIQLRNELKKDNHVAITPDGPTGPIHEAKQGAILLSSKTGVPIQPMVFHASKTWKLGSWDKLQIPKPFSHLRCRMGDLVKVSSDLTSDEIASETNKLTNAITSLMHWDD